MSFATFTTDDVARHIKYRSSVCELDTDTAERMLALLNSGGPADYAALFNAVTLVPPPELVFHTAPPRARQRIVAEGLRAHSPSRGQFGSSAAGQPEGVYAAAEPDVRGAWARDGEWDVWRVTTEGLSWKHDRLNIGCWVFTGDIPSTALALHASRSLASASPEA